MLTRSTAVVLSIVALAVQPARAQTVEEFYKGNRITITVGYGPGGGYDVFARLLGRHLGKHIPGSPQVVVQNMPGAGSLTSVNYLSSVAPKDGTTFGIFSRDMPLLGLLGHSPNARFDPRKFTWIGSSSNFADDAYVLIVRDDAPVKSIAELRTPGGQELVLGYRDSAAVFLAMERNEVSGRTIDLSAIQSVKPDWLKPGGGFRLLVQYARRTRHPNFADVPTARELALTDSSRALIDFTETPLLTMARPYAAPPSVPEERAKALQTAFLAAHRDPQFVEEAGKIGLYTNPVSADEIIHGIERMSQASPELLEQVRKLFAR